MSSRVATAESMATGCAMKCPRTSNAFPRGRLGATLEMPSFGKVIRPSARGWGSLKAWGAVRGPAPPPPAGARHDEDEVGVPQELRELLLLLGAQLAHDGVVHLGEAAELPLRHEEVLRNPR